MYQSKMDENLAIKVRGGTLRHGFKVGSLCGEFPGVRRQSLSIDQVENPSLCVLRCTFARGNRFSQTTISP